MNERSSLSLGKVLKVVSKAKTNIFCTNSSKYQPCICEHSRNGFKGQSLDLVEKLRHRGQSDGTGCRCLQLCPLNGARICISVDIERSPMYSTEKDPCTLPYKGNVHGGVDTTLQQNGVGSLGSYTLKNENILSNLEKEHAACSLDTESNLSCPVLQCLSSVDLKMDNTYINNTGCMPVAGEHGGMGISQKCNGISRFETPLWHCPVFQKLLQCEPPRENSILPALDSGNGFAIRPLGQCSTLPCSGHMHNGQRNALSDAEKCNGMTITQNLGALHSENEINDSTIVDATNVSSEETDTFDGQVSKDALDSLVSSNKNENISLNNNKDRDEVNGLEENLQSSTPVNRKISGYQNPSFVHEDDSIKENLTTHSARLKQLRKNIQFHQELKLSKKERKFYGKQDKLLECYQEVESSSKDKFVQYEKLQKMTNCYAKLSFMANVVLLVAKATASVLSGSMAIITSLVDSVVDLASGVVVWWTTIQVRKTDHRKYPRDRKRMEPLAVVVLSVIMGVASLYMIKEAVAKIVGLADGTRPPPDVDYLTIGIASATVVIKLLLYILCRRVQSPTVQVLAQDHRNDVFSNSLAIVCGYVGSVQLLEQTNIRTLIYTDPVGAILISLYIAVTWYRTGVDQSGNIVGKTASNDVISKVTWVCIHFDSRILSVSNVIVYHSGFQHMAEVELCLPPEMSIIEYNEISNALKTKLETLEGIETARITVSSLKFSMSRM